MLTSGLGQRRNLSASYAAEVAQAASLDDLQAVAFRPDSDMASSFNPCYCLTKAMVNRAVQLLAADPALSERKVTVTAVDPGWCRWVTGTCVKHVSHLSVGAGKGWKRNASFKAGCRHASLR